MTTAHQSTEHALRVSAALARWESAAADLYTAETLMLSTESLRATFLLSITDAQEKAAEVLRLAARAEEQAYLEVVEGRSQP